MAIHMPTSRAPPASHWARSKVGSGAAWHHCGSASKHETRPTTTDRCPRLRVRVGHAARSRTAPLRALALGKLAYRKPRANLGESPYSAGARPAAACPGAGGLARNRGADRYRRGIPSGTGTTRCDARAGRGNRSVRYRGRRIFAWRMTLPPQLQPVATIKAAQGPGVWSIETDARGARLRAVALAGAVARPGHSFELWALPQGGGAPVSLGLLPDAGQLERTLSATQQDALAHASKLAVSLEPPRGSPSGAPTGPVLFVAELKTNV